MHPYCDVVPGFRLDSLLPGLGLVVVLGVLVVVSFSLFVVVAFGLLVVVAFGLLVVEPSAPSGTTGAEPGGTNL